MAHKFFTRQDTQLLNRIQEHLSYEFPEIDLFKSTVVDILSVLKDEDSYLPKQT